MWGRVNSHGFGTLCTFTGILTKIKKIFKLYQRGLLASARNWVTVNGIHWILQKYNDPKHCSRLCIQWKTENDIKTLERPSQSPDLNLSENDWAFMKLKL